jgi:hypothetical protein
MDAFNKASDAVGNAANNAKDALNPHFGESDADKTKRKAKETAQGAGDAVHGSAKDAQRSAKDTSKTATDKTQEFFDDAGKKIQGK